METENFRNEECWYKEVCQAECKSTCVRYLEMKFLMDNSMIPKPRQIPSKLVPPDEDLESFIRLNEIKSNIVDFVDNGDNLYIMGNCTGNGKTSWSIKLMLKYFDEIWSGNGFRPRGLFVHIPTFLLKCKDFNHHDTQFEELKQLISTVDLVIWDDIGSVSISNYDYSQLMMYLDNRLLSQKSNIYTGNLTDIETMTKALGAKLSSRIWSNNTEIIEIVGGDRR